MEQIKKYCSKQTKNENKIRLNNENKKSVKNMNHFLELLSLIRYRNYYDFP